MKVRRKFLHVNVTNPPLWFPHSWVHDRHTASGTWAEIEFYPYPDANAQELPEHKFENMRGKWRENQVPRFDDDVKKSKRLPRGFKDTCDIASGDDIRNQLDIAMKIAGDSQCYGYNLETEFYRPSIRNPDTKLEGNRFLVKVMLRTAGQYFDDYFQLSNGPNYADCKLLGIDAAEKKKNSEVSPSISPFEPCKVSIAHYPSQRGLVIHSGLVSRG